MSCIFGAPGWYFVSFGFFLFVCLILLANDSIIVISQTKLYRLRTTERKAVFFFCLVGSIFNTLFGHEEVAEQVFRI